VTEEPTPPHSEEQTKWIEEHKSDPAAEIAKAEADLAAKGATITGRDIPTPIHPGAYIKQQIEFAEMVGAKVDYDPMRVAQPRWPATWLDMPREHVCHCAGCGVWLGDKRESPHHYSIKLGDAVLQVAQRVDGEWTLLDDVVEVNVDEDYAIRVTKPLHECGYCQRRRGGGGGVCLYKDKGEFGVRLEKITA
jgi:hypothetical protein